MFKPLAKASKSLKSLVLDVDADGTEDSAVEVDGDVFEDAQEVS
jgi:hypothetical protein